MSEAAKLKTTMTETQHSTLQVEEEEQATMISRKKMNKRRRRCLIATGALLLLLLTLIIVSVVLALTLFKSKQPRTKLVSATLEGIAPRVSFPAIDVQLNVTLDVKILVDNPNRASFKHGEGKSLLLYRGNQVGETDLYPGLIPARGSAMLLTRLTLELDEFGDNLTSLIGDLLGGQLSLETVSRIPGRVSFLGGIIKKHIVAVSHCQFTVGIPDMKIRSQICKNKTKF